MSYPKTQILPGVKSIGWIDCTKLQPHVDLHGICESVIPILTAINVVEFFGKAGQPGGLAVPRVVLLRGKRKYISVSASIRSVSAVPHQEKSGRMAFLPFLIAHRRQKAYTGPYSMERNF